MPEQAIGLVRTYLIVDQNQKEVEDVRVTETNETEIRQQTGIDLSGSFLLSAFPSYMVFISVSCHYRGGQTFGPFENAKFNLNQNLFQFRTGYFPNTADG